VTDVPVLAELAGEIASDHTKRQAATAWQEVVERLLFDRIHRQSTNPAVGGGQQNATLIEPHKTFAALAIAQNTSVRAQAALDTSIAKGLCIGGL